MSRGTRRDWLRRLATVGSLGLAGCGGNGPEDRTATDTPFTDTDTPTPAQVDRAIDFGLSVSDGKDGKHLELTGRVTSPAGVVAVTIEAGDRRTRLNLDGATQQAVEAVISVGGGQAYEISVTVHEPTGDTLAETIETGYVPLFIGAVPEPDRLVGAHYYPWYEMHGGHQNWTDSCVADPVLGEYAADDPTVIDQHLTWCLKHGIRWLSMSWWGPLSPTDPAIRDAVLEAERMADLEFSILYETKGRLEDFNYDLDDSLARDRLRSDLAYLEREYFGRENYLHLDGRPVVFVYIANTLVGDLPAAFDEIFGGLETRPYLLADVPFGTPASSFPATQVADAVTAYNPYSARPDIAETFHDRYAAGSEVLQLGAEAVDVGYVPVVIPGYNDTEIPDSQREDNPVLESSPERFERVIEQAGPHLADADAVLVTSFNEWYENTQVEPNQEFGTAYLELVRDSLASGSYPGYETSGTRFGLSFDRTVRPVDVNPDNPDTRELAFMADSLRFSDGPEELVVYDIGDPPAEPLLIEGAFGTESTETSDWRWFGGFTAETTLLIDADVSRADRAVIRGQPMVADIEADVSFGGEPVGQLAFGDRDGFEDYEIEL